MLTGSEIRKRVKSNEISIVPFDEKFINPNSYDLTLSGKYEVYRRALLDVRKKQETYKREIPKRGCILKPGNFYLMSTNEIAGSNKYIPMIEGKSSIARLGISVHVSAGFGDLGFIGTWTLEVVVARPIRIYPNMRIAQVYFVPPTGSIDVLYQGKYKDQKYGPIASRAYKEFERDQET